MTKIAAIPIYVINLYKLLLKIIGLIALKISMLHLVFKYFYHCPNDDLGSTLAIFTAKLLIHTSSWNVLKI